jgi:hypothetical protein
VGGSQLIFIFIGLIGQYLACVFEELKGRTMYILKQEPGPPPVRAPALGPTSPPGARLSPPPVAAPSRSA